MFYAIIESLAWCMGLIPNCKYEDDGKPIPNETHMVIHCRVAHRDGGLYSMPFFTCGVCAYTEECEKYRHRHNGKAPYET